VIQPFWSVLAATVVAGTALSAQASDSLVIRGRQLARDHPAAGLRLFEQALEHDSLDYEANWRAAVALADLGQETPDEASSPARDSLYSRAERYARRAVAADTTGPDGYFALAMALGRVALTKGTRERLRFAEAIRNAALRSVALNPAHDGAHHVLGLWNAEVMRLSGLSRFIARSLLGGRILSLASWEEAITQLSEAVRLDSTRIYHRLDLARVLIDRKRYREARRELELVAVLPDQGPQDRRYRREAALLLIRIEGKTDKQA